MHREERILRGSSTNSFKTEEQKVKTACDGLTSSMALVVVSAGRRTDRDQKEAQEVGTVRVHVGRFVISNL